MLIYILSRNKNLYSTSRIFEEGRKAGHQIRVINHLHCDLLIENNQFVVLQDGEELPKPDYIIPRIGANVTGYGEKVIRHFEKMGVKTLTSAMGLILSRDKFKCMQCLVEQGIAVPTTYLSEDLHEAEGIVTKKMGYPFILKLIEGTQGIGVFLIPDQETAQRYFDLYSGSKNKVIVQKFVSESFGRDIRIIVVGDQVVAAMERVASANEFRSNIHRGGSGKIVKLSKIEEDLAIKTTKVLGLNIAGVDIIRSANGPLLLEVNSSPGIEGIEKTTAINVAAAIIEYIAHGN
ncbi:30S ribosomal protein S6--L-glutamate ligase [Putridiphycobacter roseus]|uniref:30S ribosomal protein S6--L-glutamate ligase n=1 Tax=Putridiphycobacter roseus TaxID=2219161 RepID=A0A2W1N232_9FLAO|nr:RimK family alpha-L-glutamate ligase [Putridiphycobacter roseus]PZE18337.1 30S ribosomal protein S6--L-glutamate ligase [Putridiphycobacter roseus]